MNKLCTDSGRRLQQHLVIPASRNLCLSSTTDSGVSQALAEDLGAALMEGKGGWSLEMGYRQLILSGRLGKALDHFMGTGILGPYYVIHTISENRG